MAKITVNAFNFSIRPLVHTKNQQTKMHSHATGQLYFLNSGMISGYAKNKYWSIVPNCIGWIPMTIEHSATMWGNIAGWSLYLPASLCDELPLEPCVLKTSDLASALMTRIVTFTNTATLTEQQIKIIEVLIDEVKSSQPIETLLLPQPTDARLIKITQAIWHDPTIEKSQQQWAKLAAISVRSLSRHFKAQTGITFSHWKQLAKVMLSLEQLAQGIAIKDIAYSCGFSDASSYIASFKSIFGVTPRRYFSGYG
ncbi:helix-turn-helix transcriptional regulator [Orbus sturtevantii]|uniref:AraC family transcriptional regulator n=1 Tax=Orbus sturtevantii TaxID=3074109 RepID=UPI00370D5D9D